MHGVVRDVGKEGPLVVCLDELARGLADGKDGVGVSEDQTLGCKLIETRRLQKVRAGKPGLLPAQIVGEDEHDVQRLSFDSLRLTAKQREDRNKRKK